MIYVYIYIYIYDICIYIYIHIHYNSNPFHLFYIVGSAPNSIRDSTGSAPCPIFQNIPRMDLKADFQILFLLIRTIEIILSGEITIFPGGMSFSYARSPLWHARSLKTVEKDCSSRKVKFDQHVLQGIEHAICKCPNGKQNIPEANSPIFFTVNIYSHSCGRPCHEA